MGPLEEKFIYPVAEQLQPYVKHLQYFIPRFFEHIDPESGPVKVAVVAIAFNPIFWNFMARSEWNNRNLTNLFGDRYTGCYVLAVIIFVLGIVRDYFFERALASQPAMMELQQPIFKYLGAALFLLGNTFVLSSMWALGITGTYLGDYFGILMDDMVTSFPFNILSNPMYVGSAMSFFGTSFWYGKPVGFLLSIEVCFMYFLAMLLEGPFTTKIYAMRDEYFRLKAERETKKDE